MYKTLLLPLIVLSLAARPLAAQDVTCIEAGDKNPTTARVWGIVPGAGHVYACEFLRGVNYYFVTTILVGAGYAGLHCFWSVSDSCERAADVALAAGIGLWAWSIYDAGRAAERTNAKRRSRVSPILMPVRLRWADGSSSRALRVGLSVRTR